MPEILNIWNSFLDSMKHYKMYIGGKWINGSSGRKFYSINPATGERIASFEEGNEKDVRKALSAAEKAFQEWKNVPAPKRAGYLLETARVLKERKEELAECIVKEMGKVEKEARGDVQEAIDVFEYMHGEGRRLFGYTTPSEMREKIAYTVRLPVGVCSLITPWNFPIAVPSWKLAPALVCGNAIVFKPSSDTPLCATKLVEALIEAGVPKGVVNLVFGSGATVGKELVVNEKVRGVSFTGSKETGEWILKNAGIKKIGLELGGKNAVIVMDDAKLDLAVEGILWSAFGTTGQRCTAASRVIVHRKVLKELEKKLVSRTKRLKIGFGGKKKTDIGPLINARALEKSKRYVEIGRKEGKLLCGGTALQGKGFFFKPTIFSNVKPEARIAREEIFGPILSIIPVSGLKEAINVANSVRYGLSSSIYTEDMKNAFTLIQEIEAGLTYINSSTIGSEVHLPFGGVKETGSTREAGILGIEEFTEMKTVYFDYSGKLQKAQIDEYEKKK